jgi:hypothetical protein
MTTAEFWKERSAATPGKGSATIVPSDSQPLAEIALSLFVEGAGSVAFVGADGKTDVWTVPAGTVIPVAVQQVLAKGTTPGLVIHAIY